MVVRFKSSDVMREMREDRQWQYTGLAASPRRAPGVIDRCP